MQSRSAALATLATNPLRLKAILGRQAVVQKHKKPGPELACEGLRTRSGTANLATNAEAGALSAVGFRTRTLSRRRPTALSMSSTSPLRRVKGCVAFGR